MNFITQQLGAYASILGMFIGITVPLGILLLTKFRLRSQISSSLVWFLAPGIGTAFLTLINYLGTTVHAPLSIVVFFLLVIISLLGVWRPAQRISLKAPTTEKPFIIIFVLLVFVFSVIPLTVRYGFARDYDFYALGIRETRQFVLPYTNIPNYYPPGTASLTAFFSYLLPFIPLNQLMLILFHLVFLSIVPVVYVFGNILFKNGGIFLVSAFFTIESTRNALVGGATYPALLANLFSFLAFFFFASYYKTRRISSVVAGGLAAAGVFISHLDIFFAFAWGFLAFMIASRVTKQLWVRVIITVILAFLITIPYVLHGMQGATELGKIWTDKMWCAKVAGESHPKSVSELIYLNGQLPFALLTVGAISAISRVWKRTFSYLHIWILIWSLLMIFQNSVWVQALVRPVIHIYPLNIIMWQGLLVLLTIGAGYGLSVIAPKEKSVLLIALLILPPVLAWVDYQTLNIKDVYRPKSSGYLLQAFADRNTPVSDADINAIAWIKEHVPHNATLIVPNNEAGYLVSVNTERDAEMFFYDWESYHDPRWLNVVNATINRNINVLHQRNTTSQLPDDTWIFLPNSIETNNPREVNANYSTHLFDGDYCIVYRQNGVKVLKKETTCTRWKHLEAEAFANTTKSYAYGRMIQLHTAVLNQSEIALPLEQLPTLIAIKHLTFLVPMRLNVSIGNWSVVIDKRTFKLRFSETLIDVPQDASDGVLRIVPLPSIIPVEVDWVEMESFTSKHKQL